ncbi:MAG: hypothetical protein BGN88_14985 [Clostridiales bacterium 43-6]|nr:MAG: hypothetical protein BGN88_14985 [Clostridiales bacterium 43-6]
MNTDLIPGNLNNISEKLPCFIGKSITVHTCSPGSVSGCFSGLLASVNEDSITLLSYPSQKCCRCKFKKTTRVCTIIFKLHITAVSYFL